MFDILTSIVESLFKILFELLSMLFGISSKKKAYRADFASEGTLLSRWNKGFSLTGRKQITLKDSFMNCMIAGMTGSGKSQVCLLPTIFTTAASLVINDPSGEIFNATANHLLKKGYDVKVLHFSKPEISAGFNPVSRANSSSEIQKLAAMLIRTSLSGGKEDPFWTTQATSLLVILISILKTQAEQFQNLYNVRQLLNQLAEKPEEDRSNPVDALFTRFADPVLYNEYKSIISYDDKLFTSIIATAKSALTIFADESVARVTASDTIDFADFRKKPTVLYLQNSISDQKYYSALTSIFFEQLTSYILSRFPEEGEQDIFLLIDEFSSLRVPVFPAAFANVRKHRAGIMAVVQDFNQVVGAYGKQDAEAIRSNCFSKVYFGGASLETTRELSEILGKSEYKDDEGKKQVRPLLTNDEIRMLKQNRALLICGHHAPILASVRPAYKSLRYRAYMAIKPPSMKGDTAASVPILPLNHH